MIQSLRAYFLLLVCSGAVFADNWPGWRGPQGNGHSAEKDLPLRWSTTENVRWKVALPDDGNSTPIVWGQRVFLTQSTNKGTSRWVMCFDRAEGKLIWKQETVYKDKEATHRTNPHCAASPVTDGERVIACLGSAGLVCYDLDGKELWRKDVGKMDHIWGNASSPILHGDLCILWVGPGPRQILLAVNKKTGETVWEHEEPGGQQGADGNWIGSWSTPIIARVQDHEELILMVPLKVKGFDPRTGKELWSCSGLGKLAYTSPVISESGIVLAVGGYHGPGLAVRAGGKGDVTKTHRLWHHPQRNPQRIGSAVVIGDNAYLMNERGLLQCIDLTTGKDVWTQDRLCGRCWSSQVLAGDRMYINTEEGDTLVFSVIPEYKLLAKNSLGELIRASVATSDGDIFIRTYKHLWCIGQKK